MEQAKITSKEYLRGLQVIYLALLLGTVSLALVSLFVQSDISGETDRSFNDLLLIVTTILSFAAVLASNIVFRQKLNTCLTLPGLYEKLTAYRSAIVVRLALVEAASYFLIVAYLLTGNLVLMALLVLILLVFLIYRPTKEKLITDLELSAKETDLLNDPETVLNEL